MTASRWQIEIVNPLDGKLKIWDHYVSRERAESVAATLRHHKIFAQIRRIDVETEEAAQ